MKNKLFFIIIMLLGTQINLISQETIIEELCINLDDIDSNGYNIFDNDAPFQIGISPILPPEEPCYFFSQNLLFLLQDSMCCGIYTFSYTYPGSQDTYIVDLTIKCEELNPKPDCSIINLSEVENSPGPMGGNKTTLYACDESPVTYFVNEAPGQTITWDAGAVPVVQGPDNVGVIIWPSPGSYTITVTIGSVSTTYCIEVLDSPIADFTIAGGCGCINTEVGFMSTGIGGNEFYWDFGDGSYGSGATTSHSYASGGIYNVTLIVIQDNFDPEGNPLCCCSDTITMPVEIQPLEGPPIYWISTLCEGDSTKYWTTAEGCTYLWTAVDANGVNVLPLGADITSDSLCVVWGDGPFGEVSLQVTGCTDTTYCPKPTTAIVPIIEDISTINGKDSVCFFSSEFYDLPKWPTVEYIWEIVPSSAGVIVSGNGTNSIIINWLDGPANATIIVHYSSDFLGGIFGHVPEDCVGYAELDVTILPKYELKGPSESKFCIDETINFSAGPKNPSIIYPTNFIWNVDPPSGPSTSTTVAGTSPYVTSFSLPGFYTISVYPSYPNPYCNDTLYKSIEIVDVPLMDSITGPKDVCPGDVQIYFGHSSTTGTEFSWLVTGGSPAGPTTGNPLTVMWGPTPPYVVSVSQSLISDPMCESDTISCVVNKKSLNPPYQILGPGACTNELMTYSVNPIPSDPDVQYEWEIDLASSGSVVSGDTGPVVDIQWNDNMGLVTVRCTLRLCAEVEIITRTLTLNEAAPLTFVQNMPYCIGATGVTLTVSTVGATYNWSGPGPTPPPTQTIPVTAPGNYVVTVTETSGCTAVANYEVFENGLPNVNLSSPDILDLCIQDAPNTVDLHALVGGYSYVWYKSTNGGAYSVVTGVTTPILTHTNNGVAGYCTYYYIATDLISGCSKQSNVKIVTHNDCTGGGPGCVPAPHSTNVTSMPSVANCNVINFTTTNSINVTVTGWDFNDPSNSNVYTGPITAPTYTYTEAGYYVAYMYATVPNTNNTALCTISDTNAVCIPLAADFDYTYNCGVFTFTSTSTSVSGAAPTVWNWNFGDSNTGTGMTTSHPYSVLSPTNFTVTLTIMNSAGCTSTYSETILVNPLPTATIIANPMDTCVNKPFAFSNGTNAGVVGWHWDFDDGSTNGGSTPLHSYLVAGNYEVTLTVTDENGCTGTGTKMVTVHPAAVEGPITYMDDLFLCPNESLVLNAPAGNQYIWNTGATTSSITVMTAGVYGVTVSDINGCTFVPDSVEVIVYPPINAAISGNPIICDDGCTTLYANTGAGFTYAWEDQTGTPIPAGPSPDVVSICFSQGISEVHLIITDGNLCMDTAMVNIQYFTSPDVTITPSDPDLCAGTPNILTASSTFGGPVDFSWSTGAVGNMITVILEGTYYVTATDPSTGCSSSTFIVINPLPDLCIVPTGCYTTCDPDTLCAPDNLIGYEWYFNGVIQPIWSGMQCIIVTESGAYNFEGTNNFNCTDISDTLYLEMVPCCREGDTSIDAFLDATAGGLCCYSFNYSLAQDIFYSFDIRTGDADLALDVPSVSPLLTILSSLPTINSFENSTSGNALPQGPINGFATICLENVIMDPVEIIVDWRGEEGEILCSDTLYLECDAEPDCVYVASDSIYCEPGGIVIYEVEICNPADADYDIAYLDFLEISPAGTLLSPSEIDLTSSPLAPGDCITVFLQFLGSGIANQTFCYSLVGHEANPNEDPSALCCTADETYCVFIPGCTPCDMTYVSSIDSSSLGDCCYDLTVNNYYNDMIFDGIDLCVLTPGATFSIFNPLGSPWNISGLTSTTANLDYNFGSITHIPFGDTGLPTICVGETDSPYVDVEIKWIGAGDVICRDTVSLLCPGDCGYLSEVEIICGPDGTWIFTGFITNTSLDTMGSAFIDLGDDLLNAYDTSISLNGLAPGDTYGPFSIVIPITANIDELCVITTLHVLGHDDIHEDCCEFKTVLQLPDCPVGIDCNCGSDFEKQVEMGINCVQIGEFTYEFSPIGNFSDCDKVIWNWKDSQTSNTTTGNQVVTHTFPGVGDFSFCMIVIRTQPDGKQCEAEFCKDLHVFEDGFANVFPNPATNFLNIILKETTYSGLAKVEVIDVNNRVATSESLEMNSSSISTISVENLKTGIYIIRIQIEDNVHTELVLISN